MSPTLSQRFFHLAGALGLATIAWIGWGFIGHSWLALAVTALIAATFVLGALELQRFRTQTAGLDAALGQLDASPAQLGDWLEQLPTPLREPVRQRVEAGRGVLPGPALTPYLVGLLVMLGMLGTFLGMVVTFQGTVFALEGSADLGSMRAALAAPIRGLGLSFGTSVAGVAASALLGLMAAQSRRERAECARRLDVGIARHLRGFSLAHRREAAAQAAEQAALDATLAALGQLQVQGEALPTVAEKLAALMDRLERRGEQLDAQLLERQAQFQREAAAAYADLSRRVGLALEENLRASLDRVEAQAQALRAQSDTREQAVLQERAALLQRLDGLADSIGQQASAQRAAIDSLAANTAEALAQTGAALSETTTRLTTHGEAFGGSVDQFQTSTAQLLENLRRIEAALASARERQDEQLAYYVAQAREVIDLSIASQQGVIENLRQLQGRARTQARAEALAQGDGA